MKVITILNALDAIGIEDTNKLFTLDKETLMNFAKPKLSKITKETIKHLNHQIMEIEMKPKLDEYDEYCITRLQRQVEAAEEVLEQRRSALA